VFAIASTVPPLDAVRIGLGFFNTEEEIQRFAHAVALLAAHTPETVPPRRRLTVLGGAS
jgi:selenocysteine lyase/cysteine desulfurase